MADSENDNDDNLENNEENKKKKKNNKYDDKFKYYNYDDNKMYTMYLKNSEIDKVKIDKVQDYYDLFLSILKSEPKFLHTKEHLWVLGIDANEYSVCLYIVTLGYPNFFNIAPSKLFKISLLQDSVKIIICQSKPDAKALDITPTDLDLTNAVYHKAEILGLELVDHIVISNVSIDSKKPFYCSHLENGAIYFVQNDMTYKAYKDVEPEIVKARNEFGADKFIEGEAKGIDIGEKNKAIEMAKKMLLKNKPIEEIMEFTELTKKEILKIKKDMGL